MKIIWKYIFPIILAVFLLLLVPFVGVSSHDVEIKDIEMSGSCKDFTITVATQGIGEEYWDLKLDFPGEVYDFTKKKWVSSFYYIEKALYSHNSVVQVQAKLANSDNRIAATAKLRNGNRIIEKDFFIIQSCPQPLPGEWAVIIAILIILIFGYGLTWWWKQGHVAQESPPIHK